MRSATGALLAALLTGGCRGALPNLVFLLVDDLGVGYPSFMFNNPEPMDHPALDQLALHEGFILDHAHSYRFCSPSRASAMTGRAGWRHTASYNNLIPFDTQDCVDLAYDMLPARLGPSYSRVHIGKWHLGLSQNECTPLARGFDHSYGYLTGGEDHWTQHCFDAVSSCPCRDIWNDTAPSIEPEGTYNTYRFTDAAVTTIQQHAATYPNGEKPLFMYLALQVAHAPVEAPADAIARYHGRIADPLQRNFTAMVTMADEATGNVTDALKATGMWNNTLLVWAGDNGSPIQVAGSNAILRGGKGTYWDGGYRVPAFVTGGLAPSSRLGTRLDGLFHFSDIYATFLGLAGLNASDTGGPAPVDGVDMWPYWTGQVPQSPRTEIVHDHFLPNTSYNTFNVSVGALRMGRYKVMTVPSSEASWYGWWSPNATCRGASSDCFSVQACSPDDPCLFDIVADPGEHTNLAKSQPQVLQQMLAALQALDSEYHAPLPGPNNATGYCGAIRAHDNFLTPWVDYPASSL